MRAVGSHRRGSAPRKISRLETKVECFGTATGSLVLARGRLDQTGGKLRVSLPPNQGETVLQSQELLRSSKTGMR